MKRLIYPVIVKEFNDADGHYFVATSPNIEGMVTEGDTFEEAVYWSEDAIATMLEGQKSYPKVVDVTNWKLEQDERLVFVSVDMQKWLEKNGKVIRKTVTVPEYLSALAKEQGLNSSRILTEALHERLGV